MNLPTPQEYKLKTPDNFTIRLTRYTGGNKGPVMVVHGVSVWSGMFTLPTVMENFVLFLVSHGYDVWLLDWRASIDQPLLLANLATKTKGQFTLDDVAANDYPTAVKFIREQTRRDSIQAMVHCVGSISFFMSLALGYLPDVRCVASSQVALHPIVGPAMKLKAHAHLASMIADLKMTHVSPLPDPDYPVFNGLLGLYVNAVHHECDSTVCHRMTFMYGHLYPHNTLNVETHERLDEQLGPCNITTLIHLQQSAIRGYVCKFDYGPEQNQQKYGSPEPPSYLQDASHMRIPITFVSGELNQCFLPESTMRTYDWLRRTNGTTGYTRTVIPNFGHFDNFVGAEANKYCYPAYLEQLEKCP